MRNLRKNQNGFSIIEAALVLIIVALLVATTWVVYKHHHKNASAKATTSSTSSSSATPSSTTTKSSSTTTPPNPYAGWTTAQLKYEDASFEYPSTWKISNVSTPRGLAGDVTPGSDQVTLTSPTNLKVIIDTGVTNVGDGPYYNTILSAAPITTLGGNYYLGFGTDAWYGSTTSTNDGCVGTTAGSKANYPFSKNISASKASADKPFDVVCIMSEGSSAQPMASFTTDASFNDAKLIVASLKY